MIVNLNTIKNKETKTALKSAITDPKSFANILRAILKTEDLVDQDREHFWVIGLNTRNKILYIELLSLGTKNQTLVNTAEIFRLAIMKGAAFIICGHNHPSGDSSPSDEDAVLVKKIMTAGDQIGIEVLDHIIVGKQSHFSFKSKGMLTTTLEESRTSSLSNQRLKGREVNENRIIVGYFSDPNNYSNRWAKVLTNGDIATIFDDLKKDHEDLDKIKTFSSFDVIVNETALIVEEAGNACLFLSDLIKPASDFTNLVNFLGDIQNKLEDCFVYLKLLRDTPDITDKIVCKPASGSPGQAEL